MRQITDHQSSKQPNLNDLIRIEPGDEDKCPHKYNLYLKTPSGEWSKGGEIRFQKGPLKQIDPVTKEEHLVPPNGFSTEAILAVLIDHIRSFQNGELNCRENAIAITHMESALMILQRRSSERAKRGVEGTENK